MRVYVLIDCYLILISCSISFCRSCLQLPSSLTLLSHQV